MIHSLIENSLDIFPPSTHLLTHILTAAFTLQKKMHSTEDLFYCSVHSHKMTTPKAWLINLILPFRMARFRSRLHIFLISQTILVGSLTCLELRESQPKARASLKVRKRATLDSSGPRKSECRRMRGTGIQNLLDNRYSYGGAHRMRQITSSVRRTGQINKVRGHGPSV